MAEGEGPGSWKGTSPGESKKVPRYVRCTSSPTTLLPCAQGRFRKDSFLIPKDVKKRNTGRIFFSTPNGEKVEPWGVKKKGIEEHTENPGRGLGEY